MGKIKDLENKKKAAKIYSSGGGGGKGGPAVDKQSQEYPCELCLRVFKQKGRLQEHMKNQHKSSVEEAAGSGESSGNPSGSSSQPPGQSATSQAGVRVQDVGTSGGGFFSHKSPKLYLLEWTQKQKKRKPIYRPCSRPNSKWLCKVVIPDAIDAKKDIVSFLDEDLAGDTKDDAEQKGAATMLALIAGDRGYGHLLPPDYAKLWSVLTTRCKQKQERKNQAIEAQEKREKSNVAKAKQSKGKTQVAVVMSEENRSAVELAVQELLKESGASSASSQTDIQSNDQQSNLELRLSHMGFSSTSISDAMSSVKGSPSMSKLLDWLCLHVPDHQLPSSMASRSRTNKVEVIKAASAAPFVEGIDHPSVEWLVQRGYTKAEAEAALIKMNLDEQRALEHLFTSTTGVCVCSTPPEDAAAQNLDWQEEKTVLEAIYGDEIEFPTPFAVRVRAVIPSGDVPSLKIEEGEVCLSMEARNIGPTYPKQPPLIVFASPQLSGSILRSMTIHAAAQSTGMAGNPMIHDLVAGVCEHLAALDKHQLDPLAHLPPIDLDDTPKIVQTAKKACKSEEPSSSSRQGSRKARGYRASLGLSAEETEAENRRLKRQLEEYGSSREMAAMRATRQKLPASSRSDFVVNTINQSQVVIITGMPGCGKSTQVPQFILEHEVDNGRGSCCNIICTQPRRISALGLAARVSEERGESCGQIVGYSIRNQTSRSRRTRILFCTTGVLLRRMISDPGLVGVSHVLVDEVHERSVEMDLLLLFLKENLKQATASHKIVLMSATANASDFSAYFSAVAESVPIVHIPGFTHPVRTIFLEKALNMAGSNGSYNPAKFEHDEDEANDVGSYMQGRSKKIITSIEKMEIGYDVIEAIVVHVISEEAKHGPAALLQGSPEFESAESQVLGMGNGAILIFMPGAMEIGRMARKLSESNKIDGSTVAILQLHAALPSAQQKKVFEATATGVRKIVISTNVAETSVTIPDVTVVIDTCLAKEVGYDAERRISRLQLGWVSQASANQRAGRAGRVQCGVCFRLVTGKKWKNLREYTEPEITRIPLEPLSLMVVAMVKDARKLAARLQECITPPDPSQIQSAVRTLREVGALSSGGGLTPLGLHLVKMPVDCRVGKMLIYGAMLQCLDPVLTIAAAMSCGRPMFMSPMEKREEAKAKKSELYASSTSSKSDHIAMVAAFNGWIEARQQRGGRAGYAFSKTNFLSEDVMQATLASKKEFAQTLVDIGFLSQQYVDMMTRAPQSQSLFDLCASNSRFVRAALCAGFYPSVLRVENPPKKFVQVAAGAKEVEGESKLVKIYDREKGRVFIHPSSVNFGVPAFESGWLLYTDMVETGKVYVRQSSMVPVYGMLVFGGELSIQHEQNTIMLDRWARFSAPPKVGVLIKELRSGVEELLNQKIHDPDLDLSTSSAVHAVMKLLETDGF